MQVLRIYHAGRDREHRGRERALVALGVEVTLVVPAEWSGFGADGEVVDESFQIIEQRVIRAGDVNRHAYADRAELRQLIRKLQPDVLDIQEEPFSVAAHQWLASAPPELPAVMYTAQNVDKRYPPPFSLYERRALDRVSAVYPCSRQAASVIRGKGFGGLIEVVPLGFDPSVFSAGEQSLDDEELLLTLVGRLVPEKGVRDAVRVLARLNEVRPSRLVVVGAGPEEVPARELASALGVDDRLEIKPWRAADAVADVYRRAHIVLVPSVPTSTWTEQFGRVIVEAQASGAVVVGYATGSIPEVGGDAAALVRTGDVRQLAAEAVGLVSRPEDYALRRERGFELSRSRTWTCVAERQADLYGSVVAGRINRLASNRSPRTRRALARAE